MIHACQARALSDLDLQFDLQPPVQSVNGYVASLVLRGSEVTEVGLKLVQPIDYLPGQYCKFKFRGFPMRSFSPTLPADGSATSNHVTLHVKKVRGGLVSNALGQTIQVGHKLRVEGPFGAAYYRQDTEQRLILVAGGTGFAPILSILMAALEDPNSKPIVLIIGARNLHALYMASNLINFHKKQDLELIVTTTERSNYAIIRYGTPLDFVPELRSTDGIYAAGSPKMVTRLAEMANKVDANFYADPFESSSTKTSNWLLRGLSWCGRLAAA
jgi:3-phenylpropionate/trans-cinnamate dioxygenase ferredoxin reductase subunit